MNKITLIGNLTRDPELRTTQNGNVVCGFTLAVNRRSKTKDDEADFFRIAVWGQNGENCHKWLRKGSKAAVEGSVSLRTYKGQDGAEKSYMEVMAGDVEFLSSARQTAEQEPMPVELPKGDLPF